MLTRSWRVLGSVAAGTLLASLDVSLVTLTLPEMVEQLPAPLPTVEWVVTAYLAAVTGLGLAMGRLGDLWGARRMFLAGLLLFAGGGFVCAAATAVPHLVAGRILQGCGTAALLAVGPALVTTGFPPHQRGLALGVLAAVVAMGLLAGAPLAAALHSVYTWDSVFWVTASSALAVFPWSAWQLPELLPPKPETRFDWQGAFLTVFAVSTLLLSAKAGEREGWAGIEPLGLAFSSVFAILWLVRVERETEAPLLDLTLFRNGRFTGALAAGMLNAAMVFALLYLLPFFLTVVKGYAPSQTAAFFLIVPALLMICSPWAGALSDRVGTRGVCVIGLGIMSLGLLWAAEMNRTTSTWGIALRLGVVGVGLGLFQSPNNSAVMGSVPPRRLGAAGGLLATTRNLGMVLGIALAGMLFNIRFQAETGFPLGEFADTANSDYLAFATAMRLALQVAATLGAPAMLASLMKNRGQTQEPPTLF